LELEREEESNLRVPRINNLLVILCETNSSCSTNNKDRTKMVFMTKTIVSALFGSALAQRPTKREPRQAVQESGIDIRRYKDLKLLALHYMPDFDERKYWAYGCNCLILGDRPMSDPGYGRPVDKLDNVCKAYKVSG
jgi:hypothetical protein